jgi:hypothetical protein
MKQTSLSKEYSATVQQTVTRTLLTYPVSDKVVAVKLDTLTAHPDGRQALGLPAQNGEQSVQFFAKLSDVKKFAAGKIDALPDLGYCLVTPEILEYLSKNGWFNNDEGYALAKEFPAAYDTFAEGKGDAELVVKLDFSNNLAYFLNGDMVPTGIRFNYIDGRVRNDTYHLDKAADCLLNNPQVNLGAAKTAAEAIVPIPYYNCTPGSHSSLVAFVFSPTRDQMQALMAKAKSYKSRYYSTELRRAIFDLDLLGLRAAGAAKYTDFWESDKDSDEDSAED